MNWCGNRKFNPLYCRWISVQKVSRTSFGQQTEKIQLTFHLQANEHIWKSGFWYFSVSGSFNEIKIEPFAKTISQSKSLHVIELHTAFQQKSFLEVNLEMTMSLSAQSKTDEIIFKKSIDMTVQYKEIISNNKRILTESKYSDFTFHVQGTKIMAHKAILASASAVFDKLFCTKLKESYTNDCQVLHIEPLIFKYMLSFIYSGELPECETVITRKLFEAAHYYQIEKLVDICKQLIHYKLSVDNAEEMYSWAYTYEIEDVKTDAWNIIRL